MWGMFLMHGGKYPGADCDGSSISTEYVSSHSPLIHRAMWWR